MTLTQNFNIKGIGQYLPPTVIESSTIEEELNLEKGWINTHLGVNKRHKANGLTGTDMGVKALKEALKDANIAISDLDYLIGAAASFDHIIPNRSSLIKHRFEEAMDHQFPCIDINTVCTSFISAMHYAHMLLQSKELRYVAIVSSEVTSYGLNPNDKETYSLFGDGAVAVILERAEHENQIVHKTCNYSEHTLDTIIEGGGNAHHPKHTAYDAELFSFKMQGNNLLKKALVSLPAFLEELCKQAEEPLSEIDSIIPHQASKNGLKLLVHLNNGKTENIENNLAAQGNCLAASIPLALCSAIKSGRLSHGKSCMLIGTAAGLSIDGIIFKYYK